MSDICATITYLDVQVILDDLLDLLRAAYHARSGSAQLQHHHHRITIGVGPLHRIGGIAYTQTALSE